MLFITMLYYTKVYLYKSTVTWQIGPERQWEFNEEFIWISKLLLFKHFVSGLDVFSKNFDQWISISILILISISLQRKLPLSKFKAFNVRFLNYEDILMPPISNNFYAQTSLGGYGVRKKIYRRLRKMSSFNQNCWIIILDLAI